MGKRGPPPLLDAYNHILWFWYIHENHTLAETRQLFREHVTDLEIYTRESDFPSLSTLQRTFARWEFCKYTKPYNSQSLNRELWVYFYHWGLNDKEILSLLHHRGYQLSTRG